MRSDPPEVAITIGSRPGRTSESCAVESAAVAHRRAAGVGRDRAVSREMGRDRDPSVPPPGGHLPPAFAAGAGFMVRSCVSTRRSAWRTRTGFTGGARVVPLFLFLVAASFLQRPTAWTGEPPAAPEAGQRIVRSIEVRGACDETVVLRAIGTRVGQPFDTKVYEDDFRRIAALGIFRNIRMSAPIPWPGGVKLVIEVEELPVVGRLVLKGNRAFSAEALLKEIGSREGGRYDEGLAFQDSVRIADYYKARGYRNVSVSYKAETVAAPSERDPGEVSLMFDIREDLPVGIRSITFRGNRTFAAGDLKRAMKSRERRLFRRGDLNDELLEADRKAIEIFYQRHGYMDVSVSKPRVLVDDREYRNLLLRRQRRCDIAFDIEEGAQYRTGTVAIEGAVAVLREEILAAMQVKPGGVYSDVLLAEDRRRIADIYGRRGRPFTNISFDRKLVTDPGRLKVHPHMYDVTVRISEGPEVNLRDVITRGNTRTKDRVIIREIELFPGDRVDTSKIERARERLLSLNYFDEVGVSMEPAADDPESVDLIVDVTERPTGQFEIGVGYSMADQLMGNLRLTQTNFDFRDLPKSWRDFISGNAFVGAGQRLSLEAVGSRFRQRYLLSFREPWMFDRPIRFGFNIYHATDTYRDLDTTRTGMDVTLGRRLWGPRWDGDVTVSVFRKTTGEVDIDAPSILRRSAGEAMVYAIEPRLIYDSRDNVLFPSKGHFAMASVEDQVPPGDQCVVHPSLSAGKWFTLYRTAGGFKHVLELRGRVDAVWGYGPTPEVPIAERFFLGGMNSVRGFRYRSISPRQQGYEIGGRKAAAATVEYTFPIFEDVLRGAFFVDAGCAWDGGRPDYPYEIKDENRVRVSTGGGILLKLPISPLPVRLYF
ncbi:MAG: BamA/TamA family outer membrane protein, partial [Planctomycetota bacterium]|nr:BamA/TamA family outer membrane protein [Planctomycetota bacterium]